MSRSTNTRIRGTEWVELRPETRTERGLLRARGWLVKWNDPIAAALAEYRVIGPRNVSARIFTAAGGRERFPSITAAKRWIDRRIGTGQ